MNSAGHAVEDVVTSLSLLNRISEPMKGTQSDTIRGSVRFTLQFQEFPPLHCRRRSSAELFSRAEITSAPCGPFNVWLYVTRGPVPPLNPLQHTAH